MNGAGKVQIMTLSRAEELGHMHTHLHAHTHTNTHGAKLFITMRIVQHCKYFKLKISWAITLTQSTRSLWSLLCHTS